MEWQEQTNVKQLTHLDKEDANVVHDLDPHSLVRVRHLADGDGDQRHYHRHWT